MNIGFVTFRRLKDGGLSEVWLMSTFWVLLALLTVFLTSCTVLDDDTSESQPVGHSGSAIAFNCTEGLTPGVFDDSTARGTTRTANGTLTLTGANGTESLQSTGFGVFACHTGIYRYASSTLTPNMMYNQQVTFNASNGQWDYSPVVYWPSGDEGVDQFVSFFAYAPYSNGSADDVRNCIVDFSLPSEKGDPWLVYRLGGTEDADGYNGWKASQQDLVYAFRKDQTKGDDVSTLVSFDFKHALACVGDAITLKCDYSVESRLKRLYTNSDVTLKVNRITLDYQLTPKGKLVLNDAGTANWHAISSGDALVHRKLVFTPDQVMARATSPVSSTNAEFVSGSGHGIFYIPLENGDARQKLTVTADYTISSDDPSEVFGSGTATTTADLSYVHNANEGRNISMSFKLPEETCTGLPLSAATVGMVICSHGKAHAATTGTLNCGGEKVAVVAYVGQDTGEASPYTHGLALAMNDAGTAVWADAADIARAYRFADDLVTGAHPAGTSRWFLADAAQWSLMTKALTGATTTISAVANTVYEAASVSARIMAAGGTAFSAANYWTVSDIDIDQATAADLESGALVAVGKGTNAGLRPAFAF